MNRTCMINQMIIIIMIRARATGDMHNMILLPASPLPAEVLRMRPSHLYRMW